MHKHMWLKIIRKLLGNKECTLKEGKKGGREREMVRRKEEINQDIAWFLHIYSNRISATGYLGRNFNYFLYPKWIVTTYLFLQLYL